MMGLNSLSRLIFLLMPFIAWSLSCESSGQCQSTELGCQPDRIDSCYPFSGETLELDYGYTPSGERISTDCVSGQQSDIRLKQLAVEYVHVNPRYVEICLNWSTTNSSGSSGGYKIRLKKYGYIMTAFCIPNFKETSVCIRNILFEHLSYYEVEVLPSPLAGDDVEYALKLNSALDESIEGCAAEKVQNKNSECLKRYEKPANLSVASIVRGDSVKDLNISWNHSENFPIPEAYFVAIQGMQGKTKVSGKTYFKVINSTQILVSNLNATLNYSARVQAYQRCSGLGVYYFDSGMIGCGHGETKHEEIQESFFTTTYYDAMPLASKSVTTNEHLITNAVKVNHAKIILFITVPLIVLIVVVGLLVVISVYLYISRKKSKISPTQFSHSDVRIFLFCSPSVSDSKLEYIHKNITANLTKYFRVITMEELVSGDISKWLEKTVNSVNVVLIVANKEFLNDWSSATRPPELYCMESLISAAILQDAVTKFAFISTEDSTKNVCIPENSYLKLMQVFLMGTKINQEAELYHFVTKSRKIVLDV